MNNKIPAIITIVSLVAAAGGIAIGIKANQAKLDAQKETRELRDRMEARHNAPADAAPLVALKDASALATNNAAELMEQLAARDAELERLRAALENRRGNDRDPGQFQDRMARLKEEDPERYAEMVKSRTEHQEQMRYDQATRLASFMEMDTSSMTAEELANHKLLIEKLSSLWEKTAELDPENPPNRETMREVFGSMREIGELMDVERSVMFKQLGAEVGLSGSDAEDFASYASSIIDATSMRPPGGRGGPAGGPPNGN